MSHPIERARGNAAAACSATSLTCSQQGSRYPTNDRSVPGITEAYA